MSKVNGYGRIPKEEYIRHVRAIGESLIKNAESIAGNEEYCTGIDIFASVEADRPTEIEIRRRFAPERLIVTNKFEA